MMTLAQAASRTWTNSDGDKTFRGEATKYDGENVTVRIMGGKILNFPKAKLSAADIAWLDENKDNIGVKPKAEAAAKENETAVGKEMAGKLQLLKDGKFEAVKLKPDAKYFVLYFSASWCGPCCAMAPHSVEVYNKKVAKSKKVELVHCSCDRDEASALKWATQHSFPWPTMLAGNQTPTAGKVKPNGIPTAVLVDADGNEITRGQVETCVDKALELAK